MNDKQQVEKIQKFIQDHKLAVLATVNSDGMPEAAVIGFYQKENLELCFGTFESAKKYSNLKKNSNVALVIGWDKGVTVQYEGNAYELNGEEAEEYKMNYLAQTPSASKYVSAKEEKFFKVIPKIIRYSDLSVDPWETFEIRF